MTETRDRSGRGSKKGRAKTPTPLRVISGDATPEDLEREVGPGKAGSRPRRPAWLKDEGAKQWDRLAPSLHRRGLLDEWGATLFAVWCNEVGDYIKAATMVNQTAVLVRGHRNVLRKNPALSVQRDALPGIRLLAAEFGLSPASRIGLEAINALPLDTEVKRLLSGQ
jgi:P27 family predicted phage terminase small subunit